MAAELVVSKISSKVGQSGGIESTGRVQIGDIVTALSVNGEESTYLALGPQRHQHEHASHAYSTLQKAAGHIRIQVERYETKVQILFEKKKLTRKRRLQGLSFNIVTSKHLQ